MNLAAIGVNELHDGSYSVDRTNYFGTYLLLMLKTPAMFNIDGEWTEVPETTAILYAPKSVQQYKAIGGRYIDDWLHIEAEEGEIERFGIEMNTPLMIKDAERTYTIFRIMKEEYVFHEYVCNGTVSSLLEALLHKLSESSRLKDQTAMSLNRIRRTVMQYPMREWLLADAARMASLSVSRFETLYSREFGVSFGADVIAFRIEYAKDLLAESELSIKQISAKCGYSSESYFARQFKKSVGLTPMEYRRKAKEK